MVSCSGSRSTDLDQEIVLRVSAVAGITELVPGLEVSGSSAAALDLVFDEPSLHIESMSAEGSRVILIRRSAARFSSQELAAALRAKGMASARALDETRIEVTFADNATASLVAQYQAFGFELGPFQIDAQDDEHIRLVRRGAGGIDAIELMAATRSDEWRKLMAHDLDVIPWAASPYRDQFEGVGSVRVVDIPVQSIAALYFNVRAAGVSSAEVRRTIAGAISRKAIARLSCGDASCAVPDPPRPSTRAKIPSRLSLAVAQDDSALLIAAKVLRHQLWSLDTELQIRAVSIADLQQLLNAGEFELALFPLAKGELRFGFFLSPGHARAFPVTGYSNPEYDAAVDRRDVATADAILEREAPVTPLFEMRSFAAIDSRFCGEVVPSGTSWRWLAELYPCGEGPTR